PLLLRTQDDVRQVCRGLRHLPGRLRHLGRTVRGTDADSNGEDRALPGDHVRYRLLGRVAPVDPRPGAGRGQDLARGPGPDGRHRRHPACGRYRAAVLPTEGAGDQAERAGGAKEERRPVSSSLELSFLQDGAQPADRVAVELADFITGAQRSLDIAIYDRNLTGAPAEKLRAAVQATAARGVAIRLLYNVDFPNPIPVPPPSQADTAFIASLGVPTKPVSGVPDLMHHKYIVRDGATDAATVSNGSLNWT